MIKLQDGPLTLFESALYKTMSAVVETDDAVIIVDPCWLPHEVEEIRQYADGLAGVKPKYVLFTHSDYDHIIGYGAFPDAVVIASAALADKPEADKEAILEQIRDFEHSYYLERDYEIDYPIVTHRAEADGQVLDLGDEGSDGTRLTFYLSPGHNEDGIYTVIEPLGLLFAGDYWSDLEFPYIYFSSIEYETSISKLDMILAKHAITRLIPGHGNSTTEQTEMKRRQQADFAYIAAMREAIQAGDQATIDRLIEGCKFPRNMSKFHRGNQTLFERELKDK
ncbi:MBL fold metallo-hydrolase [Paenibacillus sp. OV219]|uniref:MBL fold metallo-hydrolase n=1 Tax=Paenibacillus sp. OV219 TaxID=1884377 RepID=UPI0008C8E3EB|nr:MBL fold metallo-hydrolase [Paenibacillus sp. OV219]SEN54682.1 Glyoxylase, beta-lactamase superfamily II [Paenibacillus sp. OV219]